MVKLRTVLNVLLTSVVIIVACAASAGAGSAGVTNGLINGSGHCSAASPCRQCHQLTLAGAHRQLGCATCHGIDPDSSRFSNPAGMENGAAGCVTCHRGAASIFKQAMTRRSAEKQFCRRSWGRADGDFFQRNCMGCHVSSCLDCHSGHKSDGGDGAEKEVLRQSHTIESPRSEACYRCHNGYFIGWDYAGRAPRDDSLRYQRGPRANGQHYLKMLPDIHFEAGLECADCHTMASLQRGERVAKTCQDCHTPNRDIVEHSIDAHISRMECASCHAAWAAQDYATFYIRTVDSSNRQYFRVRKLNDDYVKSSYLKRQDLPPLGLNQQGRFAPIRPQFLAYYSEIKDNRPVGQENRLLAAQWKVITPHTIRRGAPMCDSCHGNARRFMLQPLQQRKYRPDLDGLQLESFWRSDGQSVVNGSFCSQQQFDVMSRKTLEYKRNYVKKWQNFLQKGAASCAH